MRFAQVVFPLRQAMDTKKNKLTWSKAAEEAFVEIKKKLISPPVLGLPQSEKRFILDTDASVCAISGILHQEQEIAGKNKVVVIYYGSRALTKAERAYHSAKGELMAVVFFTNYYRQYLIPRQFTLRTDCVSLLYLKTYNMTNNMVKRWLLSMCEFTMTVLHRLRHLHENADGLTKRTQDAEQQEEEDAESGKCLPFTFISRQAFDNLELLEKYKWNELKGPFPYIPVERLHELSHYVTKQHQKLLPGEEVQDNKDCFPDGKPIKCGKKARVYSETNRQMRWEAANRKDREECGGTDQKKKKSTAKTKEIGKKHEETEDDSGKNPANNREDTEKVQIEDKKKKEDTEKVQIEEKTKNKDTERPQAEGEENQENSSKTHQTINDVEREERSKFLEGSTAQDVMVAQLEGGEVFIIEEHNHCTEVGQLHKEKLTLEVTTQMDSLGTKNWEEIEIGRKSREWLRETEIEDTAVIMGVEEDDGVDEEQTDSSENETDDEKQVWETLGIRIDEEREHTSALVAIEHVGEVGPIRFTTPDEGDNERDEQSQGITNSNQDDAASSSSGSEDQFPDVRQIQIADPGSEIASAQSRDIFTANLIDAHLKKVEKIPPSAPQTYQDYYRTNKKNLDYSRGFLTVKREGKELIILPPSLQVQAIQQAHTLLEHAGRPRVMHELRRRFDWPGMRQIIDQQLARCPQCQRAKPIEKRKSRWPLHSIVTQYPNQVVQFDHLKLRKTQTGYVGILIMICHFSKYIEAQPVRLMTAEETAEILFNTWILRHSTPTGWFQSDRGPQFTASVTLSLMKLIRVLHKHSTPHHPQTNGAVERSNRTIMSMMRRVCGEKPTQWDKYLQNIVSAYNITIHSTTGMAPFKIFYGRDPSTPLSLIYNSYTEPEERDEDVHKYALALCKNQAAINETVLRNTGQVQRRNKAAFDKNCRSLYKLNVGDYVLAYAEKLPGIPASKHTARWRAPQRITEIIRNGRAYKLESGLMIAAERVKPYLQPVTNIFCDEKGIGFKNAETTNYEEIDFPLDEDSDENEEDGYWPYVSKTLRSFLGMPHYL